MKTPCMRKLSKSERRKLALQQKKIVMQELTESGIEYRRTKLGQAMFVPLGTTGRFAEKMLSPCDWSSQLRAMADYMEANPECSLFEDGSGKKCKQ